MTSEDAESVAIGDMLYPVSAWNNTTRTLKLGVPTAVLGIQRTSSQTKISFLVRTIGKELMLLDAGWFHPPGYTP